MRDVGGPVDAHRGRRPRADGRRARRAGAAGRVRRGCAFAVRRSSRHPMKPSPPPRTAFACVHALPGSGASLTSLPLNRSTSGSGSGRKVAARFLGREVGDHIHDE